MQFDETNNFAFFFFALRLFNVSWETHQALNNLNSCFNCIELEWNSFLKFKNKNDKMNVFLRLLLWLLYRIQHMWKYDIMQHEQWFCGNLSCETDSIERHTQNWIIKIDLEREFPSMPQYNFDYHFQRSNHHNHTLVLFLFWNLKKLNLIIVRVLLKMKFHHLIKIQINRDEKKKM